MPAPIVLTLATYRVARSYLEALAKNIADPKLKLVLASAVASIDSAHRHPPLQAWRPENATADARVARKIACWSIALNVAGIGVSDACLAEMTPVPLTVYASLAGWGASVGFVLTPTQRRALWIKLGGVDDVVYNDDDDADLSALLSPPTPPAASI